MTDTITSLEMLSVHITERLGACVEAASIAHDELTLKVARVHLLEVFKFLRDDAQCAFGMFVDIAGADYPEDEERFEITTHLLSLTKNHRIRVKTRTDEETPVPSLCGLYPAAGWYEREAFDMYGILFDSHPDLRRILTDYGFEGYPLRKDFPLTGFVELRYDDARKETAYEPVRLAQAYRNFDFISPWEGMDAPPSLKGGGEGHDDE